MNGATSQHGVVVKAIQQMISNGDLGPGDRLPVEPELAEQLGVSRGSLREGVRALVAMGVLETRQGAGTWVTSLDPQLLLDPLLFWAGIQAGPSALNVHIVRRALEVESAGLAANAVTGDQLATLQRILTGAAEAITQHDHDAAMECDLSFHGEIATATGNPVLSALIQTLAQPTVRSRMWQSIHAAGRLAAAHAEHLSIYHRLAEHDAVGARAAMLNHLIQSAAHMNGPVQ